MKQIYIAGSYTADNGADLWRNVNRAALCCVEVMRHDAYPHCPHLLGYATDGEIEKPWSWWMQATGEDLKRCDAVLVVPYSDGSKGAQIEIRIARELGIPVFFAEVEDDADGADVFRLPAKMKEWLSNG